MKSTFNLSNVKFEIKDEMQITAEVSFSEEYSPEELMKVIENRSSSKEIAATLTKTIKDITAIIISSVKEINEMETPRNKMD